METGGSRGTDSAREPMLGTEPQDAVEPAGIAAGPGNRTALPETAAESETTSNEGQDDGEATESVTGQETAPASAVLGTEQGAGRGAEPDANPNEGNEEASLFVPRGAMPAPLHGSLASLERQNARLEAEGLERIEDEDDLAARIAHKLLVPLPESSTLTVNADLAENHRYCRPWTAQFLADLARAHEAVFHKPLEVSSAVRTVEYQKRLTETNGNAAPAEGDIVSPHETGAAVDIAKEGMTRGEIAWMRRRLLALETAGKIDVEEEFRQACFHIAVYKSYAPARTALPAAREKQGTQRDTIRHAGPQPADATGATGAQGA
ncbi:MAG: DUF5715 family protein [Terracidiphilus sp.]